MRLVILNNNPMNQKAYLYYHEGTKEGVLIDPGYYPERILATIAEHDVKLKMILLTHGHYDHITAASEIKTHTNAPIYSHKEEKPMLEDPALNLSTRTKNKVSLSPDNLLANENTLTLAGASLEIIHTPGHTPGCVCYYDKDNDVIFTGDTLFKESVGRTDFPGGSREILTKSIKTKLFTLPEDVKVYPGHGDSTSIKHEKTYNPFVR